MKTDQTPRVVEIEGQQVTLAPNRRPGDDWNRVEGGWTKTLEDKTVHAWVFLDTQRGQAWTYQVHNLQRPEPTLPRLDERQLRDIPWTEMTADQQKLAIQFGLVTVRPPAEPPASARASQEASQARERARLAAFEELAKSEPFQAWASEKHDEHHTYVMSGEYRRAVEEGERSRKAAEQDAAAVRASQRRTAISYFEQRTGIAVMARPQGQLWRGGGRGGIYEVRSLRVTKVAVGEGNKIDLRVIRPYTTDEYGSVWLPDVFDEALTQRMPTLAWGHDWKEPIGRAVSFETSSTDGPLVTFRFDDFDAVPRARQALAQVQSGTIDDCSVGFSNTSRRPPTDEERRLYPGCVEIIEKADLDEVSLVLRGAVPGAKVEGLSVVG